MAPTVSTGPSPKRRRTDSAPTARTIAQANSTVHFLTGRRQNRWVQGYSVPAAAEAGAHIPTGQKIAAGSRSAMDGGNDDIGPGGQNTEHFRNVLPAMRVQYEGAPTSEQGSHTQEQLVRDQHLGSENPASASLVQYETPSAATPRDSFFSAARQDAPQALRAPSRGRSGAGLPSPAPTDEDINSPRGTAISANKAVDMQVVRIQSVQQNLRVTGHNHSVETRAAEQPTAADQTRHPSIGYAQDSSRGSPASHGFEPVYLFDRHALNQSQAATSPMSYHEPQQPGPLPLNSMRQSLHSFRTREHAKGALSVIDTGRLDLLCEAVDKNDWFYLVLSQLQAVHSLPDLVPAIAQGIDLRSFQCLDVMLCPNDRVSPTVLQFQQDFPSRIQEIYGPRRNAIAEVHAGNVVLVKNFLRRLAKNWNKLMVECEQRKAPPLVEKLNKEFNLSSPVTLVTAFRTISGIIGHRLNPTMPNVGTHHLAHLHYLDQHLFYSGYKRTAEMKGQAVFAFRETWEKARVEEARRQTENARLPLGQKQGPLPFEFPRIAMEAFPSHQFVAPSHNAQGRHRHDSPMRQSTGSTSSVRMSVAMPHTSSSNAGLPAAPQPGWIPYNSPRPQDSEQNQFTPYHPAAQASSNVGNIFLPPQLRLPHSSLTYPHENERQPRPQPTEPDTTRSALHQAHLRSPVLQARSSAAQNSQLYRHVSGVALSCTKLDKERPIQDISFTIPDVYFERITPLEPSKLRGEPPVRIVNDSSIEYRLRCAALPAQAFPNASSWVTADTTWPDNLYLEFNGTILEPRRKLHHQRHFPIDVTQLIRAGHNVVTAIINRTSTDNSPFDYVLAVEMVGAITEESVRTNLRHLSIADAKAKITNSLAASTSPPIDPNDDDDDLAVTSSTLTLHLFDPISSARIFTTPVRGPQCTHRECFDLATFLSTRQKHSSNPFMTVVDCWRCPICRGDARPNVLEIDEFLVEVRRELEGRGLLGTRAIVVEADGRWRVKGEAITGSRSASLKRKEGGVNGNRIGSTAGSAAGVGIGKKAVLEVIELD